MAVLKFVLVILLCIPLVYFIWKMFTSLVDDLDQQNKYLEKVRRKNETGQETGRMPRIRHSERKSRHDNNKERPSMPERPRDRDTMRMERMNRRNSYANLDMDHPERYSRSDNAQRSDYSRSEYDRRSEYRRPERPESPEYRPYDYDRNAADRDRGFRW